MLRPLYIRAALVFVALMFTIPLGGCENKKAPRVRSGQVLPSVSLPDTLGNTVTIPSGLEGDRINVILFWSQGCVYCKKEMPLIQPLYQKYREKGFSFVAIHMGKGLEASREMKADMGLGFTMLVDEKASLKKLYGVMAVPTMFVLDGKGVVMEKVLGGLGAQDIEKMIQEGS